MKNRDAAQVVICIPIYKAELSLYERASIKQMNKVLANYPRVFFAPEYLDFDFGELGKGIGVERFPDYYFKGVINYSALMLNVDFYKRFSHYEYMLIYQTDAFVFSDRLAEFCSMDYDYIGAPVPRDNPLWNFIAKRVGNGGLSLRRVSAAIKMLEKCQKELEGPLATIFWQWEDIFWGYCGRQKELDFKIPPIKIAVEFALQDNISHGFKRMQTGWRPFGCHGWWQMDYGHWKPIIEACGYTFPKGENPAKEPYPRLDNYLRSRNIVNMHYLWGLYRKGLYNKMLTVLNSWLMRYPADNLAWHLNMENIICLWRLVEAEQVNHKAFRIPCQNMLARALQNAIQGGKTYVLCYNLMLTMLPYLQKYDYEPIQKLASNIKESWWNYWVSTKKKNVLSQVNKTKKIIVLSKAMDEEWLVESFVRHTLTFATALLIDISDASRTVKQILVHLEEEGMPIILHEKKINWKNVMEDMDLVLEIHVNEFLLSQTEDGNLYESLCRLKKGRSYAVEMGKYAPYLPFAYNDKFIFARPLMRHIGCNGYAYLLPTDGDEVYKNEELYIARIESRNNPLLSRGIIPPDYEFADISCFAADHELRYTPE